MKRILPAAFQIAGIFLLAAISASAQDATALWQQVNQPAFDASKTATVENVTLTRDRIRITLVSGTIQFSQPAGPANIVFGAAFRGSGRVEVDPPNALEAQQLQLFTGQTQLNMKFNEATFSFTDNTFEDVAGQVKWHDAADNKLGELYADRQREREELGAELVPRLFKALLSVDRKRTEFFFAEMKTGEKGWIAARYDVLRAEEISLGRWADWGAVRLFDQWMAFPAGNRSAAEAFRDPLAREDLAIRGYRIEATVTGGAELTATTKVDGELRSTGERVLLFVLDPNLRMASVRDEAGATLPFFQPRDPKDRNQSYGDYVAVVLPQPTRAGEEMTLEFQYGGKRVVRRVGAGNYFCESFGWYPTRENSFAMRAEFEMNFRSPKKYTLVATGQKMSETTEGEWDVTSWKSEIPLAVAGFAFGDFKIYTEKAGSVDVEIYANREPDEFMKEILNYFNSPLPSQGRTELAPALGTLSPSALVKTMGTEMANTVRVFEAYFGPYPYRRLAVTNIPYSYGQGWPGLVYLSALSFLDSTQRHTLGIQDHTELTDFFRAHESSHQWWGHRVGWKSYHDQWLSEGFAEFSGNLYVLYRQNEKEFLERIHKDREALLLLRDEKNRVYETLGPVWMGQRLATADSPGAYAVVVYKKGGLILHALRQILQDPMRKNPDEPFMAMMHDFTQTFNNRPASTEDFKAIVEKHMTRALDLEGNGKMDWFFRQYVYGVGIPQYTMQYNAQKVGEGKWQVTGKVTQSGVPEGWRDCLPIYLQLSGGRKVRIGVIQVVKRETPFEIMLPVEPEKLILNAYEDTLAIIK